MIILGVTLWGSQPRHRAVYVFGVNVVTEEVEDIDVVFVTPVSIFSISFSVGNILIVEKRFCFPERNYFWELLSLMLVSHSLNVRDR